MSVDKGEGDKIPKGRQRGIPHRARSVREVWSGVRIRSIATGDKPENFCHLSAAVIRTSRVTVAVILCSGLFFFKLIMVLEPWPNSDIAFWSARVLALTFPYYLRHFLHIK
eukprot:TRINITY_DN80219_c0_g1_i1.p1 TRINITY_DN80219_c0_g1~~TRINITY_DN80219_c0_g1_i1.p1  ORF type:complete len:111 (-),score=1.03 TRINITY_DN80219_c0_g1_i1:391-723(-)